MLVRCPNCKTTYKVSDEVITGASPSFRCSRCKHTFEQEHTAAGDLTAPAQGAEPAPWETNIEPPQRVEPAQREPDFELPADRLAPRVPDQPELPELNNPTAKPPITSATESWSMAPQAVDNEPPFTITAAPIPAPQPDPLAASAQPHSQPETQTQTAGGQESTDNVFSLAPYRDQQLSTLPFITLFGLLVIVFSIAAAYYQAHPAASEGLVGRIPLVGNSVLRNNHLSNGVLLKSMEGSYQTIQDNREVFIVSGTVVNQNPVVIRKIRLSGQIFNAEGKEIEREAMWIGNALSPKIIRGMSAQDIADLQKLEPLRNFEIPPGDSVPFTLVFLKPNRVAKTFACAITAAEASDDT